MRPCLVVAITLALACGRTGLDSPVTVSGAAGSGGVGSAGSGFAGAGPGGSTGSGFAGSGPGGSGSGQSGSGGGTAGRGDGICSEGSTICDGPTAARLCSGQVFGAAFPCKFGCFNGVCAECTPHTATCLSDKELQVCDGAGVLLDPKLCEGTCVGNACAGCNEGDTRCASHEGVQTCKGGGWTPATNCPFVCVDKACGKKPKLVFVTSDAFVGGNLGGITGADDLCRKYASAGNLPGAFSAWLSDSTTSPVARFPEDVGPYQLVDGTIIANNWTELTLGVLRHKIDRTERGGAPPLATGACGGPAVWSDTAPSGVLVNPDLSCGDWSDPMGRAAVWGNADSLDDWSDHCSVLVGDPAQVCLSSAALFCFEQ